MKKNSFVACGGTGAHVMLAMVRLHILGYPFGFFTNKRDGKNFPDLFLVDQDSHQNATEEMDGTGDSTAWGEVQKLIKKHPGRYAPSEVFGFKRLPNYKIVTPLPVGPDRNWYDRPNDHLGMRFQASDLLGLITSQEQREITYSRGMMASPAVGSLLFRLKEHDKKDGDSNNDKDYDELLRDCRGNVVICGSCVGGTGSSVAPTLALRLHEDAKVMAVLVHRWFFFDETQGDLKARNKSKIRNVKMWENASGGLAYSGEKLADNVATVLVGVPESKLVKRIYEKDNKQSIKNSYSHVIAALAGMRHLLNDKGAVKPGLYGLSASDPSRLTGDIQLSEGLHSTLKDLAGQAQCLTYLLKIYQEALREYENRQYRGLRKWINYVNWGSFNPLKLVICDWVYKAVNENDSKLGAVARQLKVIQNTYDDLLKWLRDLEIDYDISEAEKGFLNTEQNHLGETKEKSLPSPNSLEDKRKNLEEDAGIMVGKEEYIALALFDWFADWVRNWWKANKSPQVRRKSEGAKGYWPPPSSEDPKGTITWRDPGILGDVEANNISLTLGDYSNVSETSPNGWPHPIATPSHFKFQIEQTDPIAIRKLEILLVGRAHGTLSLELLDRDSRDSVSVEYLVAKEYPDLAIYCLVDQSEKVYGFSSPETLLCPTPDASDKDWQKLWNEICGNSRTDWKNSENWGEATKARDSISAWLKCLKGKILDNNCWKVLVNKFEINESGTGNFGIAEWLPLSDGKGKIRIPLPVHDSSVMSPLPDGYKFVEYDGPDDKGIHDYIGGEGFDRVEGYERIRKLSVPGEEHSQNMIWDEHLNKLQEEEKIFAWWDDNDQVWIMKDLQEKTIIHIKNLRVIDEDSIQIDRCIPLIQRPVPGSDVKEGTFVFPDLPLLPEYISLAEAPPDRREGRLVDSNWKGIDDISSYELDEKNNKVTWRYHVAGRTERMEKEIFYAGITPVEAHWMVWPNFKASPSEKSQWRVYYIYEHSTRESLEARPIVLNEQGNLSLRKRSADRLGPGRAVGFDPEGGVHTGGAPVALCAYDHEKGENLGIYKVRLNELSRADSSWKIAIDFGTSHTVAAVENRDDQDGEMCKPISLESELTSGSKKLSLHISENWPKNPVKKSEMKLDLWRPTYVEVAGQLEPVLRSDIWSLEVLDCVNIPTVEQSWAPMTHYTILPIRLERRDSAEHTVSGFKWRMSENQFSDKQYWLQKKYLGMALEIFVADVVRNRGQLPTKIQFTFTYPLRGISSGDTRKYERTIEEILVCSEKDIGYEVIHDQRLYSESHAAARGTATGATFQVKLVADLGGGTLDTYISTPAIGKKDDRFKKKVADSARLGADLLLRILAGGHEKYLPGAGRGWGKDRITCLQNLRDWVRSEGTDKLFGGKSSNWESKGLGLQGFEDPRLANDSRILIDRYFRVIADFLARSLVAYVAKDVWEKDLGEHAGDLQLAVRLQGNGWRLWYGSSDYGKIQEYIEGLIQERTQHLWAMTDTDVSELSNREDLWHKPTGSEGNLQPKLGPICQAVGEFHKPEDIDVYKFPLSEVLLRSQSVKDSRKWFDALPFKVKNPKVTKLEIKKFNPPICVHSLDDSDESIKTIEDQYMRSINNGLREGVNGGEKLIIGETVDAPVAALIWENLLKSSKFRAD